MKVFTIAVLFFFSFILCSQRSYSCESVNYSQQFVSPKVTKISLNLETNDKNLTYPILSIKANAAPNLCFKASKLKVKKHQSNKKIFFKISGYELFTPVDGEDLLCPDAILTSDYKLKLNMKLIKKNRIKTLAFDLNGVKNIYSVTFDKFNNELTLKPVKADNVILSSGEKLVLRLD